MRLRKECEHGKYDKHYYGTKLLPCPGGEFLPEDELERRELDAYARGVNWRVFETDEPIAVEHNGQAGWWIPQFADIQTGKGI